MDQSYEGFYARFETPSKKMGSLLMGADNLVGDDYQVEFRTEDGRVVAWLLNKFGAEIGYLDVDGSRKVQLANARDQKIRAILSYVAYSEEPDPGMYWGEMAVFCFNPAYSKEMDAFVDRVAARIAEGVRPAINLGTAAVQKIFDEQDWTPTDTVSIPKNGNGVAIMKDHRSLSEKMIEQGRDRNPGCMVISWVFVIAVVLAIAYGVARLFGVI